jgi:hypothetical protein
MGSCAKATPATAIEPTAANRFFAVYSVFIKVLPETIFEAMFVADRRIVFFAMPDRSIVQYARPRIRRASLTGTRTLGNPGLQLP